MNFIGAVYILALVACFAGNGACVSSGTSVTNINNFSYQAAVLCPVIMCSGTILSSTNILTTTTCINNLQPSDIEVHVGSNTYYSGGSTVNVASYVKHPSFNPSTYDYNIAILSLATPLTLSSSIAPIPLATALPPAGSSGITSAYGATDTALTLPNLLQRANLQIFSRSNCQIYKSNKLTTSMFCAGDPTGGKDLCPADQGAPLVYNNTLVGIYNWGCSCGLASPNPSSPVFNSIPALRTWIVTNIATQ